MAKGKYERTKPHVNVGTIGHVDHGKRRLQPRFAWYKMQKVLSGCLRHTRKLPRAVQFVTIPNRNDCRFACSNMNQPHAITRISIALATLTILRT